ncbi:MAG: amidase [Proteobacteria bacterium]|nr:amidase [Pseudomonadota bacterium]
MHIARRTARELAGAIAEGALKAETLIEACLARIDEREGDIQAWTHVARDQARALARACDREAAHGPLHGIPIAIKDVIDTQGMPTRYGSPIYEDHLPRRDAACVALARAAGAIILGKTMTHEFAAHPSPVPTRNPRNLEHTPGGSSTGSAAAVADFMVPLAFGTQTGGSLIRPAAFCGVVGYKPTFNLIDRDGMRVICSSLDTIGVLARTVPDAALLAGVLCGEALGAFDHTPGPPRIGFCRTPFWDRAEEATRGLLEEAARRLAGAGAKVSDLAFPAEFDGLLKAHETLGEAEGARALAHERRIARERLSAALNAKLDRGERVSAAAYEQAVRSAEIARLQADRLFADHDVLITPSAPGEAPKGVGLAGDPIFNSVWTLLHVPTVTVPAFTGPSGLPIGVQVVGPRFGDRRTLTFAEWIHRALA